MGRGSSESASSLSSLAGGYAGHHGWGDRGHWNGVGITSRGTEKHQGSLATAASQQPPLQNASATAGNEGRARCAMRPATSPLMGSPSGPQASPKPITINPSNSMVTIEDQIRTVDKVIKVHF
ncbi:unnamed protein product [Toxocara canis]|uniref:Angiomotin_C domain-containing protein n=1 Tax=Toxocara canis TaxID=6265 RepID=A0A183TWR7_TOXCA|nr:unnamed protein product [Toxocara canis]